MFSAKYAYNIDLSKHNHNFLDFEDFKEYLENNPNPLLQYQTDDPEMTEVLTQLLNREEEYSKWVNIIQFILGNDML